MSRVGLLALVFALVPGLAFATSAELQAFKKLYPSATPLFSCRLCHESVPKLNLYGQDHQKYNMDLKAIEGLDSDGDGFTNIQEILNRTFPGDKTSHP